MASDEWHVLHMPTRHGAPLQAHDSPSCTFHHVLSISTHAHRPLRCRVHADICPQPLSHPVRAGSHIAGAKAPPIVASAHPDRSSSSSHPELVVLRGAGTRCGVRRVGQEPRTVQLCQAIWRASKHMAGAMQRVPAVSVRKSTSKKMRSVIISMKKERVATLHMLQS